MVDSRILQARFISKASATTRWVLAILMLAAITREAGAAEQKAKTAQAKPAPFAAVGTWNGSRILTVLIQQYEAGRHVHVINFTPFDSPQIPGLLFRHKFDLGMVLDSRLSEAQSKEAGHFENFTLGRFVVGVAVNARLPTRTITVQDLRNVFAGEITSWEGLSGSKSTARIEVYLPLTTGTAGMLFQKSVLQGQDFADELLSGAEPSRKKKSDAEVVGAVVKQSNAIGFFLYHYEVPLDTRIHILGIAKDEDSIGVLPAASTVADGTYPLVDTLTLYLHPDAPPEARESCKFVTGPEAAKIIRQSGLWPEYDLEQVRSEKRLAQVKAGKGTPLVVRDVTGWGDVVKDLGVEFVKAKAAVQVKIQKGGTRDEAVEKLLSGETELLLADGAIAPSGQATGSPHPDPLPKGEGTTAGGAPVRCQKQGQRREASRLPGWRWR